MQSIFPNHVKQMNLNDNKSPMFKSKDQKQRGPTQNKSADTFRQPNTRLAALLICCINAPQERGRKCKREAEKAAGPTNRGHTKSKVDQIDKMNGEHCAFRIIPI